MRLTLALIAGIAATITVQHTWRKATIYWLSRGDQ